MSDDGKKRDLSALAQPLEKHDFNVGDLAAIHCDSIGVWFGNEWVTTPIRWSDEPFVVVAIEAEGRRLIVNEYPTSVDTPFGVTAMWCKPWVTK